MTAIASFANHLPVKIRFGEGIASTIPAVLAELATSSVFVMVDEGIEAHNPAVALLLRDLDAIDDLRIARFDKPAADRHGR